MAIRDSELLKAPGSGYGPSQQAQRTAWNGALAQTIGAPAGATNFSPEVMSAAKAANSAAFQRAGQNVSIADTDGLLNSLGQVAHDAAMVVPESELTPLTKQIQHIASAVNDGTLSGDSYLALTRTGSPLDRLASGDGAAAWYGQQMRSVLDDFAQRSLTPAQQADFAQARLNWRNMKTIEPLVVSDKPCAASSAGRIQPLHQERFDLFGGRRPWRPSPDWSDCRRQNVRQRKCGTHL
jgi:hypothetical protein